MAFKVKRRLVNELEIYVLMDEDNKTQASIIPEIGNNLVSWIITRQQRIELIHIPVPINELKNEEKQFYGNPILFPFPGRIVNGEFSFKNMQYKIPINFRDGTAIHGFVYDRKWDVQDIKQTNSFASITSTYTSTNQIHKYFPFPFEIQLTYRLQIDFLEMAFNIRNLGKNVLPMGLGIHPYFSIDSSRSDWKLELPAKSRYNLTNCIPTGEKMPVKDRYDFRNMKKLNDIYLDDLFGDIIKDNRKHFKVYLENPDASLKLKIDSDENFDYCVIYAPENQNFICIEPYTCITNVFNFANSDITTGLIELGPQEMFSAKISFSIV